MTNSVAARVHGLLTRHGWLLAALCAYLAYGLFLTWPLMTNPGGLLSGIGISGDLGGSTSQVAYVAQHHVFPFVPQRMAGLDAPQGLPQQWVLNWSGMPSVALLDGLGYIVGPVPAQAIYLLLGFVLSGLSMFMLTRRLFGSPAAALLAGFAFAFFPWAVDKIDGHYDYMYGWVMVLMVWRMLELARRPSIRNGLLAGCGSAFAMWWTPYFILIAGVGFATLAIVAVTAATIRHEVWPALRGVMVACVPIAILFGAIGALAALAGSSATGTVRTQDINQLYTYSARWLEWLIPDRHNLLFGGLTGSYLTSHLHGSNFSESSLYLGWSVIAVASAGAVMAALRIRARRRGTASELEVLAAVGGGAVALIAAWFSSPPKVRVLGAWVPTPSWFVFHITSTWRVYTRFVELLELGLCVLAAFALARLFSGRRRTVSGLLFASAAIVLVLDLWARPPIRTVPLTPPAAYTWLRDHPGGIVVDYPIEPAVYPNYTALFWQMVHRHPLFQGYAAGSETESMKLDLADLREPKTAPDLAALGVRYVIVHPGQPGGDTANMRKQRYILRFANPAGSVWQVGAEPAPTRVGLLDNFSTVEGGPGSEYRWMTGPGVLGVYSRSCASCTGTLSFLASSAIVARHLTVTDDATGKVLTRVLVTPNGQMVTVRVPGVTLRRGQARIDLNTDIPPENPHNGDPRVLSIEVQEPRFTLTS